MTLFAILIAATLLLAGNVLSYGQGAQHDIRCTVSGPDSIPFDKTTFSNYLPPEFEITVSVVNFGQSVVDSVVVFPRSNQRFTIVPPASVLLAAVFRPGDSLLARFTLRVNPKSVSGDDTLIVAVSGKDGARTECRLIIWVEKEYRPVNVLLCPPEESIFSEFVDSLNAYVPNPLTFPLVVENRGDAPSRDTRILYVATPSLTLADGQPQSIDLGNLAPGQRVEKLFQLRIVPRNTDTTVTVRFRVQGKGGIGDRIIDTICTYELHIPAAREVLFELQCENHLGIRFENGRYTPNPFLWTVHVRNVGNSRAKDVRATIALPVSYVLEGMSSEQLLGDLNPDEEAQVQWTIRALPVFKPDSSLICVRVFDAFNRMAECCDSIILPSVRAPHLQSNCIILPDTIRVDVATGLYQPSEFFADLILRNTGTDPADTVQVELIIADPDINVVSPAQTRVYVGDHFPENTEQTIRWVIAPLPIQQPRDISILFRVTSRNHHTITSACNVYIEAALLPEFTCDAYTFPDDTLHYSISTLEYDPLRFTATIRNVGNIAARNIEATILLPSDISLPANEDAVRRLSTALGVDSSWTVSWSLSPRKKREGTLDTIRVEFRSGLLRSYCETWIFVVGIPPVTVFTIPRDALDRYGMEVTVPILIDESQNKDIREIDLLIGYDNTKIAYVAFETDDALFENGWLVSVNDTDGLIRLLANSLASPLSGIGELLRLRFRVIFGDGPDALRTSGTMLTFDSLASSVNKGSVLARFHNGYITVSGDCLYPLRATENYVSLQNRPNPFNPGTLVNFTLRRNAHAVLLVRDVLGRTVAQLCDGQFDEGTHEFRFDALGLPSGSYLSILFLDGEPAAYHRMLLQR